MAKSDTKAETATETTERAAPVEIPEELSFADVERPATTAGRPAKPNPFTAAVKALAASVDAEGRSVSAKALPVPEDEFNSYARKAREAGADADVTVQVQRVEDGAPEGHVMLVFSTRPRIRRAAKDAADE